MKKNFGGASGYSRWVDLDGELRGFGARRGMRGDSQLDDVCARVRTRTEPRLRTEVKDGFRALRDVLEPDDRELLVLRVDRGLAWEDVARVMLAELRTECARLRKRYQLLKDDLRRRAREAGLVGD